MTVSLYPLNELMDKAHQAAADVGKLQRTLDDDSTNKVLLTQYLNACEIVRILTQLAAMEMHAQQLQLQEEGLAVQKAQLAILQEQHDARSSALDAVRATRRSPDIERAKQIIRDAAL